MMSRYAWPALLLALSIATPASALTLVNQGAGSVRVLDASGASRATLASGGRFEIPASWGDDRHLWFDLVSDDTPEVCGTFRNKWGTIKMPAHFAAVGVAEGGDCVPLAAVPEDPPEPPADPVDEGDPPAEENEPTDPEPPEDPAPVDCEVAECCASGADPAAPSPTRSFPPKGNGTWVYDARFLDGPDGQPYNVAGLWAETLRSWNESAEEGHRLDQVFSYGGDLEMECLGFDDCTPQKMHVYYYPPSSGHPRRSLEQVGASGFHATQAYAAVGDEVLVIPVFDGRFDGNGYLRQFHTLDEAQARAYGDIFARTVCADPAVAGVQLDLEPFDLDVPAQAWFYDQVASNLAGANEELESIFGCVNERFPQGRFFSVFTFAREITPELGEMFTRYGNGYVVLSLYDLGSGGAGVASRPDEYGRLVAAELEEAVRNSDGANNVPFQLAIPAAASTKEFESYNGAVSGYAQSEYVAAALDAIDASGIREDERFLGMALWGFSRFMAYPPHTNNTFEPASPPPDVASLLADRL